MDFGAVATGAVAVSGLYGLASVFNKNLKVIPRISGGVATLTAAMPLLVSMMQHSSGPDARMAIGFAMIMFAPPSVASAIFTLGAHVQGRGPKPPNA